MVPPCPAGVRRRSSRGMARDTPGCVRPGHGPLVEMAPAYSGSRDPDMVTLPARPHPFAGLRTFRCRPRLPRRTRNDWAAGLALLSRLERRGGDRTRFLEAAVAALADVLAFASATLGA